MTRTQKIARARELRERGLTLQQIGERMDVNFRTVHDWLNDPDLARLRARKDSYRGTCIDCGGPTNGSDGRMLAPRRCRPCRKAFEKAQARWTREAIIEALRAWDGPDGIPPRAEDWRRASDDHPACSTVQRMFGTWNAAVLAAGFDRRAQGSREWVAA